MHAHSPALLLCVLFLCALAEAAVRQRKLALDTAVEGSLYASLFSASWDHYYYPLPKSAADSRIHLLLHATLEDPEDNSLILCSSSTRPPVAVEGVMCTALNATQPHAHMYLTGLPAPPDSPSAPLHYVGVMRPPAPLSLSLTTPLKYVLLLTEEHDKPHGADCGHLHCSSQAVEAHGDIAPHALLVTLAAVGVAVGAYSYYFARSKQSAHPAMPAGTSVTSFCLSASISPDALVCHKCRQPIKSRVHSAFGRHYHTQCYTCVMCGRALLPTEEPCELEGEPACDFCAAKGSKGNKPKLR